MENEAQIQRLKELNCNEVQGYLPGRRMPENDLVLSLSDDARSDNIIYAVGSFSKGTGSAPSC